MASSVPRESRSPLSSPFGAKAPDRCSPRRGAALVSFCPSREKPGLPTLAHMQPVPSAQPWQQYVSPSCVYPSPGHWFLIIPQAGHAGSGVGLVFCAFFLCFFAFAIILLSLIPLSAFSRRQEKFQGQILSLPFAKRSCFAGTRSRGARGRSPFLTSSQPLRPARLFPWLRFPSRSRRAQAAFSSRHTFRW